MGATRRKANQAKVEAAKPLEQQTKKEYDMEAMQMRAEGDPFIPIPSARRNKLPPDHSMSLQPKSWFTADRLR